LNINQIKVDTTPLGVNLPSERPTSGEVNKLNTMTYQEQYEKDLKDLKDINISDELLDELVDNCGKPEVVGTKHSGVAFKYEYNDKVYLIRRTGTQPHSTTEHWIEVTDAQKIKTVYRLHRVNWVEFQKWVGNQVACIQSVYNKRPKSNV
jgi:hypothetical protein